LGYDETRDLIKAREFLDRALALWPSNAKTLTRLGKFYLYEVSKEIFGFTCTIKVLIFGTCSAEIPIITFPIFLKGEKPGKSTRALQGGYGVRRK